MATVSVLLLVLFSVFSPPVHSSLTTFHVIPVHMTQSGAQAACRENYTDLVTVYSDENNTQLYNLTMKAGGGAGWLGLYRGQFSEKWSNGDPVTFSNLAGDCGTSSCCAVMKPDGSWESLQCTETKYFMCYGQVTGANKDKPNYHLILENKTWYEAQRYCRWNDTDLVSIRNQTQNEEVKIKGLNSSTSFWIGLLRDDWQWTDGGNSVYRNWWSGEPWTSPSDCVILIGGKWMSWSCSSSYYPLCYCSIHVSAEALSWQEALDYCNEGNRAGILNIDSEAEQEEVESELRRRRVSAPLWVGLRQSQFFGFWIWTDGTAVFPYFNWDGGKPPEGPLSQHCGSIVPPDYRWRDMNCQARYRALCHIKCSP